MCESYNLQFGTNFIAVQPTNLYGPNDNFDLEKSHVLPALLRKIHLGKALENNDWNTIKKDLNKLPIEGITGENSEDEILAILSKYGVRHKDSNVILSQPDRQAGDSRRISTSDDKVLESDVQVEIPVPSVVEIWGSGKPMREFLWSEDMADACVYLMEHIDFKNIVKTQRHSERSDSAPCLPAGRVEGSHNVISSQPDRQAGAVERSHLTIKKSQTPTSTSVPAKKFPSKNWQKPLKTVVGFKGDFYFNTDKPDGTLRKLTDPTKLNELGWQHKMELEEG